MAPPVFQNCRQCSAAARRVWATLGNCPNLSPANPQTNSTRSLFPPERTNVCGEISGMTAGFFVAVAGHLPNAQPFDQATLTV